jgi:hypothetical protein
VNPLDVDSDISDDEEEIIPSEKALGKRRVAESEDEDSGSGSSDEDDTEDLLRELEKIKAERAAERERLEREKMYGCVTNCLGKLKWKNESSRRLRRTRC